jgi:hypothetical protein
MNQLSIYFQNSDKFKQVLRSDEQSILALHVFPQNCKFWTPDYDPESTPFTTYQQALAKIWH